MNATAYLYIAHNQRLNQLYIGIGGSLTRIFGGHNRAATRLIHADDTTFLQTVEPFASRADAEMAEAAAIRVAAWTTNAEIFAIDVDSGSVHTIDVTNISAMKGSEKIITTAFTKPGEAVRFADLTRTVVITAHPDRLTDGRGSIHAGRNAQFIANRVLAEWPLASFMKRAVVPRRLLVRLKTRGVILADYDLNPDAPVDVGAGRFNVRDALDWDPRGLRGLTLDTSGTRLGTRLTHSSDCA